MTTGGEGGMVTTNSEDLWSKMWSYKDHGKSWEAVYEKNHPPGFRWLHESFGTNWRMMEVQAVIGRFQLKLMSSWNEKRVKNANRIWEASSALDQLRVPTFRCHSCHCSDSDKEGCVHAGYKCYVFVDGSQADVESIIHKINARGVPCFSGSCSEVYLEKAFQNSSFRPQERLPNAKELGETSLMFLCHPTLSEEEIEKTCQVLTEVVESHFHNGRA